LDVHATAGIRTRCAEHLGLCDAKQRWALADSSLLQAIAADQPVVRGMRGRRLQGILAWADRMSLVGPALLVVGFFDLIVKLRQQRARPCTNERLSRLFVGFGAGAEEVLFSRYREQSQRPVARVNQVDIASMGRVYRVGAREAIRNLWAACRTILLTVRQLPDALSNRRIDFLTHGGLRLGGYSYMRAWFEGVRDQCDPDAEVCFLAADTPAFAAADAGLRTRYLQHGFVRRSLLLPEFDSIDALTDDEARHFARALAGLQVSVARPERCDVSELTHEILVASVYELPKEMRRISPVLEWARSCGWRVRVRPHPREDRAFWSHGVDRTMVQIEDADPSFEDALRRLRPRIVVSWYSTALAEALNRGIVPVTVSDESTPAIADMVYPLMDRALQWPRDQARIAELMRDDAVYCATLQSLSGEASRSRT